MKTIQAASINKEYLLIILSHSDELQIIYYHNIVFFVFNIDILNKK